MALTGVCSLRIQREERIVDMFYEYLVFNILMCYILLDFAMNIIERLRHSKVNQILFKIKPVFGSDAIIMVILMSYLLISTWVRYFKTSQVSNMIVYSVLITTLSLIFLLLQFKPILLSAKGICSFNRFIKWDSIVTYTWSVHHTDKIEKLTIKHRKRIAFFFFYNSKFSVQIASDDKERVDQLIKGYAYS